MDRQQSYQAVERFVEQVQRRVNRRRFAETVRWAAVGGAAAMVLVASGFIAAGYRVPIGWYAVIVVATVGVAAGVHWLRRCSMHQAVDYADRHFDLHDGVTSLRGFMRNQRQGPWYELQATQVGQAVAKVDPTTIRGRWAPTPLALAAVLMALAVGLAFVGPSQEVQQRRAQAAKNQQRSEAENQRMQESVEDLVKDLDKAGLDKDQASELKENLKKWVNELEKTKSKQQALKQYAKFQQRIDKQIAKLDNKRQQELLSKAAKELAKTPAGQKLSKALKRKDYKKAAKELKKLDDKPKENLEKRRENLDKLKDVSGAMNKGAQQAGDGASGKPGQGKAGQGKNGEASEANMDAEAMPEGEKLEVEELAKKLEELDKEVEAFDGELKECEACKKKKGQCDGKLLKRANEQGEKMGEKLALIRDKLDELDAERKMQSKLAKLRGQCQTSQARLAGRSAMPSQKPSNRAGKGSADSQTDEKVSSEGKTTVVEGQQGEGPSLTKVEAARTGSGVSRRQSREQQIKFERRIESFVERPDVPQPLRDGVRRYFENIQRDWQEQ